MFGIIEKPNGRFLNVMDTILSRFGWSSTATISYSRIVIINVENLERSNE